MFLMPGLHPTMDHEKPSKLQIKVLLTVQNQILRQKEMVSVIYKYSKINLHFINRELWKSSEKKQ